MLSKWFAKKDLLSARCIRCMAGDDPCAHEIKSKRMSCRKTKSIAEYSMGPMKKWLTRAEGQTRIGDASNVNIQLANN
eukprot:7706130-Karenia_brevis.AAC.1